MSVTVVTAPSGGVAYTDNGNTVYLEKREPRRSSGTIETVDTWGGPRAAINEFFGMLSLNPMAESISVSQNGAASTMTVTWPVSPFSGETPQDSGVDDDVADKWDVSAIEIPTALAAHPYFQVAYAPGSGQLIEDYIAAADLAISNGEPYTATSDYKEQVSRYYALRMAGVEEWPQIGVQVSRSFKTVNHADVVGLVGTVGQVVAANAIGMPAGVLAAVAALNKINSYTSADPADYVLAANAFEWLHKPLDISVTQGIGIAQDRYDVKDVYWGIWKWSAVLYPGGSWDPQGATA